MGDSSSEILERVCALAAAGGYAACGAADRADLAGAPAHADPERVLPGYRAVLVLAAPPGCVSSAGPYGPALLHDEPAETLSRVRHMLEEAGHRVAPVAGGAVSLPRAAAAAGIGEVSPVGMLVAPGFGLSLTLVGLVTDAPLGRPRGETAGPGICRACGRCTDDCPAVLPGAFDSAWCTGCGVCVVVCPLADA